MIPGDKFGRLTLTKEVRLGRWEARCDCGTEVVAVRNVLLRGNKKSCGCLQRDNRIECNRKHKRTHGETVGKKVSRLYRIWDGMRARCYKPVTNSYDRYGGRGITVVPEWHDFAAFKAWALAAGYADDFQIDRLDSDGPYAPWNCRWVTCQENQNNRSDNRHMLIRGERLTVAQAARRFGLRKHTIYERLNRGWSDEDAVAPARIYRRKDS